MNDKDFEKINIKIELTLIRVFLEVRFGVGDKIIPCLKLVRIMLENLKIGMEVHTHV